MKRILILALTVFATAGHAELRVPAFTAYALPEAGGARISQRGGVTRWTDPALTVNWYGQFKQTGEVTTASFSHDPTGRSDRFDRFMGVENGQFFLSHGGFVEGFTAFGEKFTRPATGRAPSEIALPPLPH